MIKGSVDKFYNFNNKVTHEIDLEELIKLFENNEHALQEYIFMEYLVGDKYSADILVEKGNTVDMVIRNNGPYPKVSPRTMIADIVFDTDICEYSKEVCKLLSLDDFAQIEVGRDLDGDIRLIEINGRLDASLAITKGVNLNYYELLIRKAINSKFPEIDRRKESFSKLRFMRYLDYEFIKVDK